MWRSSASIAALAFSAITGQVEAFFIFGCSGPVVDRLDPIVTPGQVSHHVYSVFGASNFAPSMSFDEVRKSQCSSYLSSYWVPQLYFKHPNNGSYTLVKATGAALYYLQRPGFKNEKIHAFPDGLRMVAGDSGRRTFESSNKEHKAISFVCLSPIPHINEVYRIPDSQCREAQVFFPSCWDGKNVDSNDHKSHMAYPIDRHEAGNCPASHPVHLISLFMEVYFDLNPFNSYWDPSRGDKHPFVFSNGDDTGYGYHGDFLNGWDKDVLQEATDKCLSGNGDDLTQCPILKLFSGAEQDDCVISPVVQEVTTGWLPALPSGPGHIGQPKKSHSDMSHKGWEYLGCAQDDLNRRALGNDRTDDNAMTIEKCIDICSSKGQKYAGLEYSRECYCSSNFDIGLTGKRRCDSPCAGNDDQICGGPLKVSVYHRIGSGFDSHPSGFVARKRSFLYLLSGLVQQA